MTMNSSGPISLAGTTAGRSIEIENGGNGTTQISLNDTAVRNLAGVASGAITMPTNFYGKSNYNPGINWTNQPGYTSSIGVKPYLPAFWIPYLNKFFVCLNNAVGVYTTSPDGVNWTEYSTFPSNRGIAGSNPCAGNNIIVAAENGNGTGTSTRNFFTSTDGVNWTNRGASITSGWASGDYITGIFFANNIFILVGYISATRLSRIYTSSDGINWTLLPTVTGIPIANTLSNITYINGVYYAILPTGGIARYVTSTNLYTWTVVSSIDNGHGSGPTQFAYGNGVFVTAGKVTYTYDPHIYTSTDFVNWTVRTAPTEISSTTDTASTVLYSGVNWIISYPGSKIITSPDGINWTYQPGLVNASGFPSVATFLITDGKSIVLALGANAPNVATSK
jgi:hypothetical protein